MIYRALAHAGQEGLPLRLGGGVVAIGNFDGVHRGHQELLAREKALALSLDAPLVALTFSPHPRRYFKFDQPPFQLSDPELRYDYLMRAGCDAVIDIAFDAILARTTATDFITHILNGALQAKHIVVGENFVFGANRSGDVALLQEQGKIHGFEVTALQVIVDFDGRRISSERVREVIRQGQMISAEMFLDRPWQMRGEVVRGDRRGRTIGFPTANIQMQEFIWPKFGVYASKVQIEPETEWRHAILNFGKRPTFQLPQPLLEVHLLDFEGDLYGKTLRVAWHDFLRMEKQFASLDVLKVQLVEDVAQARLALSWS